jgi:RNA-directed DNA polymerase
VTYAADLVILCRRGKAEEALQQLRQIMGKLKLTVNGREDTNLQGPGREVRLPGVYVWADVFSEQEFVRLIQKLLEGTPVEHCGGPPQGR